MIVNVLVGDNDTLVENRLYKVRRCPVNGWSRWMLKSKKTLYLPLIAPYAAKQEFLWSSSTRL